MSKKVRVNTGNNILEFDDLFEAIWYCSQEEKNMKEFNYITEAIRLLTANGYTVVEPKPKHNGTIYVINYNDNLHYISERWYNDTWKKEKVIAKLNWTEGDGL